MFDVELVLEPAKADGRQIIEAVNYIQPCRGMTYAKDGAVN